VFNLQGAPRLDTTALGEIIRAHATVTHHGGGLKLLHVAPRVRDLLTITRLDSVFDQFDTEADALASFAPA
jgi:anti-anti-sigma factor